MRSLPYLIAAVWLLAVSPVAAQRITVAGWVDRVDTRQGTLTIRTLSDSKTLQVAPEAVVRIDGIVSRIERLPINSYVTINALKGPSGDLRAIEVNARGEEGTPAAAYPPGSVVTGTIVGINAPMNQVTVRTRAGDFAISLGTAPLYRNGRAITVADLRTGQQVRIERILPTAASTDYITQRILVMSSPRVAMRSARPPAERVRGSRSAYGDTFGSQPVRVIVDNEALATRGIVLNGRTMLPVRDLVERMEGAVRWDPGTKTVWAAFPEQQRTVRIAVRSPVAQVYAYDPADPHRMGRFIETVRLLQPPLLMGGRVIAPVALMAKVAGARVYHEPGSPELFIETARLDATARR